MGLFSAKNNGRAEGSSIDTIVGTEASFEGVLKTNNSISIDGTFKGRIESKGHVILNRAGQIEADVVAEYISINGKVVGNVTALQQLDIGATGVVHGDVRAAAVTVEKGGVLDGTCRMITEGAAADARSSGPSSRAHTRRQPAADSASRTASNVPAEARFRTGGNGTSNRDAPATAATAGS